MAAEYRVVGAGLLLVAACMGQAPPVSGTVEGRITGLSGPEQPVVIAAHSKGPENPRRTSADSQGNYTITDLPVDTYAVWAIDPRNARGLTKTVTLSAAQARGRLDFSFEQPGVIEGDVVDEEDQPVAEANVDLFAREYAYGVLRMRVKGRARTDNSGHYRISGIEPDRTYYLDVRKMDVNAKAPGLIRAWYPNSRTAVGAAPITLRPGEDRPNTKIRVRKLPTWCIDATLTELNRPATLTLAVDDDTATTGMLGFSAKSAADGKIRACGITSGPHLLTVVRFGSKETPPAVGTRTLVMNDEDIKDLKIDATPAGPVPGEFVWDDRQPESAKRVHGRIFLDSLYLHLEGQRENAEVELSPDGVPARFTLPAVPQGEYFARAFIDGAPGCYVKEVTWAGRSVFRLPMTLGGADRGQELRVVVGQDGAAITVVVTNDKSEPLPSTTVLIVRADAATEAEFARLLIKGDTDQAGVWTSRPLAPGKYRIIAPGFTVDESADAIGRAWQLIQSTNPVDLVSRSNLQVNLTPKSR